MILRVLALFENQAGYGRPLKGFLNDYLQANQSRDLQPSEGLGQLFATAVSAIDLHLGKQAFRPERAVNAAYLDSISVGVMHRLQQDRPIDEVAFKAAYEQLVSQQGFRDATLFNTSSDEAVEVRINSAISAFAMI